MIISKAEKKTLVSVAEYMVFRSYSEAEAEQSDGDLQMQWELLVL